MNDDMNWLPWSARAYKWVSDRMGAVGPVLFLVVFLAVCAGLYYGVEKPGKEACVDSGGEVVSEYKSWHCEWKLDVVFKQAR